MFERIRHRLTYANVMSTIAVFGFLAAGGAWAAAKIGSNDIKRNAVHATHIKRSAVKAAEIASGAVGAAERAATPAARAYRTTNQDTDGSGYVTVAFDGENFDTADMHSDANPTRLIAPIDGVYLVTGNVRWSGTGGDRYLSINLNGDSNDAVAEAAAGPATLRQEAVGTARLAAGDYVELQGFEDSANVLTLVGTSIGALSPALSLVWLGP